MPNNLFLVALILGGAILLDIQFTLLRDFNKTGFRASFDYRVHVVSDSVRDNKFNYGFFWSQVRETRKLYYARYGEVASINKSLNELAPNRQVLVFGNSPILSTLLSSSHQVLQNPFLQNYNAVPPQLFDPLYVKFLQQHPNAVVFWEETEPSVNSHLPIYQLNDTYEYVYHNYRLIAVNPGDTQFLLERVASNTPTCSVLSTLAFSKGASVILPQYRLASNQYIEMKATLKTTLAEKGLSVLVKNPLYSILLTNTEGGSALFRIEIPTLGHGITLDPLYPSYRDLHNNTPFNLASFRINGGLDKTGPVNATLYKCSY
jgi:hypothetical protein